MQHRLSHLIWKLKQFVRWKANQFRAGLLRCIFDQKDAPPFQVTERAAVVISPHPDDETLGCGGLIASKRRKDVPVTVVFLCDGQSSCGFRPRRTPEQVIAIRRREALAATSILGVPESSVHFCSVPDSTLNALSAEQQKRLINRIVQVLREQQPGEVFVPHQHDGHSDHEAAYRLVGRAVELAAISAKIIQFPVWLEWCQVLGCLKTLLLRRQAQRLVIQSSHRQKMLAVRCYRSQRRALPWGFLQLFTRPVESFMPAGDAHSISADGNN